jgi:meiotic recombination protein SPO11
LITAKGQPDVATRLFVKKLSDLDIPILALVDADPYGLEIMSVYTTGSMVRI